MDGLGQVSMGIEDFKSALRYFRVAAQRGHPDGYFNLGKTYERLGRNEEAVSAYYTYVKRRPTGTHVAAAKAAIKTLEPRAKLPPEPEPDPEPQPEPSAESDPSPAEEPAQESQESQESEPAAP
jgi:tetratricopeptide (TPR) repeat protein